MSKRKRKKKDKLQIPGSLKPDPVALLASLKEKFNITESAQCTEVISQIKLTYAYLEDFIAFAKKKDEKICLTAIAKTSHIGLCAMDIEQCLNRYQVGPEHPIYYVDYKFSEDYECPHGPDFKNVWIMFIAQDEEFIASLLARFQKLKVFL